jgi:hypothetical protein
MKLLLTGLIALSMVGNSRADGFGTGIGIGIGLGIVNKVLNSGHQQQQQQPRERVVVRHTVVRQKTVVVHDKVAPAATPAPNTTVNVINNIPAQAPAQPTNSTTTLNAKTTIAVINPPTQVTAPAPVAPTVVAAPAPTPALNSLADDTTIN